ncbi:tyrosine-type recombinase/integrase [Chitinimonas sp.]|uniref:tyrosine-type recombinase/integrase n=1 Tax=Chitinimonas sp. TaxID=1934313 RepID=UPI0035AE716A
MDERHVPRYWATVWSIMAGAQLAPATLTKKLRYIENLYLHADYLRGNGALDEALAHLEEVILAEVLESWFVSIRNQATQTDADEARWQTGLDFVTSIVTWLSRSAIPNSRLKRIEERLHCLNFLYDQLHIRRRQPTQAVRSLPANVVSALYEHLDPVAARNPFSREKVRWQVYLAFFLMLHQGLRRAEALLLPVDAIKSAYDNRQQRMRYWLNVQTNRYADEDDDPRYSRPSIKTAQSIRQVPVSEPVAKLVQTYVENYRGRPDHPYLLNSQKNQPLSTESITKLFAKLSDNLPEPILAELRDRTGKESVTAHDLRHTCAVVRLNQLLQQGDSMEEALQK